MEGIRVGDWKYLEKRSNRKSNNDSTPPLKYLFNLNEDIGEQVNLIKKEPEIAARLRTRMLELDEEITANARPVWRKATSTQ